MFTFFNCIFYKKRVEYSIVLQTKVRVKNCSMTSFTDLNNSKPFGFRNSYLSLYPDVSIEQKLFVGFCKSTASLLLVLLMLLL